MDAHAQLDGPESRLDHRDPGDHTGPSAAAPAESLRSSRTPQWAWHTALWGTLALLLGYVTCERVGTRANADRVITLESHGGDAVLIGLTDRQPGFILLSRLPPDRVHLDAQLASSWITGTRTVLHVQTPGHSARYRLRAPRVILVDEAGAIESIEVHWTNADFAGLLHTAGCETECEVHAHRCGRPLEEIARTLSAWPAHRVPLPIRLFLENATS